jgi:saccharopine dehydrogenase-like protein
MPKRVLIVGGYGNFGSTIARALARESDIQLLIGGRSRAKAHAFAEALGAMLPAEAVALDIAGDLRAAFATAQPDIVIHTTGPFQDQSYAVARAAIDQGCHYIDLADARRFVTEIAGLDAAARARNVLVVSGASSVPCLTAAYLDAARPRFRAMERVEYGISAAQQTNRGLATTSAILSYVGKPFATRIDGREATVYGWQDLHAVRYPELGRRLFGNCDIPDLTLFPERYAELKTIRFSAGHEIAILHLGLWKLSWLVRWHLLPSLQTLAPLLLKLSFLCDGFGSSRSGFHMFIEGIGSDGRKRRERHWIIARSGHGPYIPCMPAILIAKGLARGTMTARGARPCLDLIDLATYRDALRGLDIEFVDDDRPGRAL